MPLLLLAGVKRLWVGELMPISTVCKRWGQQALDVETFKQASKKFDHKARAKMACSLLKNKKKYIGKHRSQIRQLFGEHDGFYFTDRYPAYMIEQADVKNKKSWQILFFIGSGGKITDVAVHKNCCGP